MNLKHGDAYKGNLARLYIIWRNMKARCYNKNSKFFVYYGKKGIKVCEEWIEYKFFRKWALSNGYEDHLTIDRIENSGNYEPNNCQWITKAKNIIKDKSKFVIGEVEQIRKIYSTGGFSQRKIAKAYKVSQACICRIANNATY